MLLSPAAASSLLKSDLSAFKAAQPEKCAWPASQGPLLPLLTQQSALTSRSALPFLPRIRLKPLLQAPFRRMACATRLTGSRQQHLLLLVQGLRNSLMILDSLKIDHSSSWLVACAHIGLWYFSFCAAR